MENANLQELINQNIYLVSAKLKTKGTAFGKIRRDDPHIANMLQKYCGIYNTQDEAKSAMLSLTDSITAYLNQAYPFRDALYDAGYRYSDNKDTFCCLVTITNGHLFKRMLTDASISEPIKVLKITVKELPKYLTEEANDIGTNRWLKRA